MIRNIVRYNVLDKSPAFCFPYSPDVRPRTGPEEEDSCFHQHYHEEHTRKIPLVRSGNFRDMLHSVARQFARCGIIRFRRNIKGISSVCDWHSVAEWQAVIGWRWEWRPLIQRRTVRSGFRKLGINRINDNQ